MEAIVSFVTGILAVVCAFGFIIFIHELGHFLTARWVDIRCPQFAIGFGPSLFGFRWRGTNFAVRAFPLGGYVLMNGEEPGERAEDPWAHAVKKYLGEEDFPASPTRLLEVLQAVPEAERGADWRDVYDQVAFARCEEFPNLKSVEGNFHDRSVWARILVISGGVIMNFLAATLILWSIGPFYGLGSFFRDWPPVISQAVVGGPAEQAGLTARDLLLKVNERELGSDLEAFHAIGEYPGVPFQLTYQTPGQAAKTITIRPWLAVGDQAYEVADSGEVTLKRSASHPELAGKKLALSRDELVQAVKSASEAKEETYQVVFEGTEKPISFKLSERYPEPRGQIGVHFGVMDIRFEKDVHSEVAAVKPGSRAEKAGFKPGDLIVQVDGLLLLGRFESYGSLLDPALQQISEIDQIPEVKVYVARDGGGEELVLKKVGGPLTAQALGLELRQVTGSEIAAAPFRLIGELLYSPIMIARAYFSKQATSQEIVEGLQGPIGIMQMIYNLADNGIIKFLFFVALLNAAIGAFNLLPFPALDGSRLVFLFWAAIRGKAVDPDKEAKIHLAGLMILLSFVVLVSFGDIKRLISSSVLVL